MAMRISALWVLLPLFFLGEGGSAQATGDFYVRQAESSSVSQCRGKLVEIYYEGGNVNGFRQTLTLACLKNHDFAYWVLIGGISCEDYESDTCSSSDVPSLSSIEDMIGTNPANGAAPHKISYRLLQAAFGKQCQEAKKGPDENSGSRESVWRCAEFQIQKSNNAKKQDAWLVTTRSKRAIVSMMDVEPEDQDYDIATAFLLPESSYVYAYRRKFVESSLEGTWTAEKGKCVGELPQLDTIVTLKGAQLTLWALYEGPQGDNAAHEECEITNAEHSDGVTLQYQCSHGDVNTEGHANIKIIDKEQLLADWFSDKELRFYRCK